MVNVTFTPYYRADRGNIVIRIFINRKIAKVVNTFIRIEPDEWNEKKREVWKHPNSRIFNQKIKSKISELEAEITKADLLGISLTQDKVKKIAEGGRVTTDFYKHCEPWIKEKYRNKDTRDAMLSDLNKLKLFAPILSFGDIDAKFLTRYQNYMVHDLGNTGNTPWKSLKFLRTMLYDAGGLAPGNPFKNKTFRMPAYQPTYKEGLYIYECDKLEEIFNEPVPVMYKVAAAKFLFMCYSGLRISDAKRFDVKKHLVNKERIIMQTKKEGTMFNLKLHDRLSNILTILNELPQKTLSDQKLNQWLKVIAEYKELSRIKLTNHIGRHTFGCILAEMEVPIEVAQRLMAHKRIESTRIYYTLRQKKIDEISDRLNDLRQPIRK